MNEKHFKHIYKHIGHFNGFKDLKKLTGKSADFIVDYWKRGYGNFIPDFCPYHKELNLVREDEVWGIEGGYVRITQDGKYAVVDMDSKDHLYDYKYKGNQGTDSYIDLYEFIWIDGYD